MTPRISATVIARDEAAMIGDCLRSVAWCDELVVLVDAATRDRTRDVARDLGARVFERAFDTFAAQRDAALALATGDWVLFVDADERATAALRDEVRMRVAAPGEVRGYWIPRLNYVMGRQLRGAGWYPDYQLRLLRRDAAHFDPRRVVHEVPLLDGAAGHLEQPLIHFNYRTFAEFIHKQERYTRLDAQRWLATYGRPRRRALLGQPMREFWRRYVSLRGYREGGLGLLLCSVLAWYAGKSIWLARRSGADQSPQLGDRPH